MAEIIEPSLGKKSISKSKKLSTRVDLTPMVDLGFLLITFFIFTTTLSEPNAIKINLPDDSQIMNESAESKTLTLILGKGNVVYFYPGIFVNKINRSGALPKEIRHTIIKHMDRVGKIHGNRYESVVLIKPTNEATYQNIVDMLDEMLINGVTRYVLMDAEPNETVLLANN